MCVRVGACVGVHHHSVHSPLHWVLVYILWSCKNLKEIKNYPKILHENKWKKLHKEVKGEKNESDAMLAI